MQGITPYKIYLSECKEASTTKEASSLPSRSPRKENAKALAIPLLNHEHRGGEGTGLQQRDSCPTRRQVAYPPAGPTSAEAKSSVGKL